MQLSDREFKQLTALRKEMSSWRRWRWFYVFCSVLLLSMAFLPMVYWMATGQMEAAREFGNHPGFFALAVMGGVGVGFAIQGFRGNPTKDLLIRVVEHLRGDGS